MSIFRIKKHTSPYVILDKTCLEEDGLSWRAKGIHAYLISKPDDWQVRLSQLIAAGKEGREAVRSAIKELSEAGYLHRVAMRQPDGTLQGQEWSVYESPFDRTTGNPSDGEDDATKARARAKKHREDTDSTPKPLSLGTKPPTPVPLAPSPPPDVQNCTPKPDAPAKPQPPPPCPKPSGVPPAPATGQPRKPSKGRVTWLTPFDDAWFERSGGHLAFAAVSRGFKQFMADWPGEALPWWQSFCAKAPKDEYHTVHSFLRNPMPWRLQAKASTSKGISATERF